MATEPKVAIVGAGRHGSGYIAALLEAIGVDAGHEAWWNPVGGRKEVAVDSSWCAAADLYDFAGAIFHQVRHPLATVTSLLRSPDWGPYHDLRLRTIPELADITDPLDFAMAVCVHWNERCETLTGERWRVEDLTPWDLAKVMRALGQPLPMRAWTEARRTIPPTVNSHDSGERLHWGDLPYNRWSVQLHDLAERYGYE